MSLLSGAPPEAARPGEARPGDARPGEARPGEAPPGEARPGEEPPSRSATAGSPGAAARLDELLARCRFPSGDEGAVALAVSGGPDSTALMVLAARAGLAATVVHVDHGLRPGSETEAHHVEAGARGLGFGFSAVRVTVTPGPDLEARARRARYAALPPGVLTGHTMDDQAETVLINVLRGAALDGWAAMRTAATAAAMRTAPTGDAMRTAPTAAARPRVRRPLIAIRRSETLEVCRLAGLEPLEDPSNGDPRFRRNRVRHELLPLLDRIAERDMVPVLARQAALAAEDADLLDQLAAGIDPRDVVALRAAPPALARRALRAWLRGGPGHHPPSSAELARIMEVVDGGRRACEISGGRRISRRAGRLSVSDAIGEQE